MEKRFLAPDLYVYLLSLSSVLTNIGEEDAAKRVFRVSRFASGSTSEFLGEAAVVLPKILRDHGGQMTESDRIRLTEAIDGIEYEFRLVGGA